MKKGLFLLSLIFFIFLGIGSGKLFTNSVIQKVLPLASPTSTSVLGPIISQVFYPPKNLKIPKIGIIANSESVGLDSQGRMDVPKKAEDVGWYNLGFKVGEKGSVVLDGHFDDVTGA